MKCEICGLVNPDERKFCKNCGARLKITIHKENLADNAETSEERAEDFYAKMYGLAEEKDTAQTDDVNDGEEYLVDYNDEVVKRINERKKTGSQGRARLEMKKNNRTRERIKKEKQASVVLNILLALLIAVILANTVYICIRRASLPKLTLLENATAEQTASEESEQGGADNTDDAENDDDDAQQS